MQIRTDALNYAFLDKPLLIGGKAMEYYNLRPAGRDINFVVSGRDYKQLARLYPDCTRDLFGDLGVCVGSFELWKCIRLLDYNFLCRNAIEEEAYKVISLDLLLILKALAISEPKYERDVRLLAEKINAIQYGKDPHYSSSFFLQRNP